MRILAASSSSGQASRQANFAVIPSRPEKRASIAHARFLRFPKISVIEVPVHMNMSYFDHELQQSLSRMVLTFKSSSGCSTLSRDYSPLF